MSIMKEIRDVEILRNLVDALNVIEATRRKLGSPHCAKYGTMKERLPYRTDNLLCGYSK